MLIKMAVIATVKAGNKGSPTVALVSKYFNVEYPARVIWDIRYKNFAKVIGQKPSLNIPVKK